MIFEILLLILLVAIILVFFKNKRDIELNPFTGTEPPWPIHPPPK